MHRFVFVGGNGEDGVADHLSQQSAGQRDAAAAVDLREVRIFVGAFGLEVEDRLAAPDGGVQVIVHLDLDLVAVQLADDIEENAGAEDAGAGFDRVTGQIFLDAHLGSRLM